MIKEPCTFFPVKEVSLQSKTISPDRNHLPLQSAAGERADTHPSSLGDRLMNSNCDIPILKPAFHPSFQPTYFGDKFLLTYSFSFIENIIKGGGSFGG
jgi:hypothetical protein